MVTWLALFFCRFRRANGEHAMRDVYLDYAAATPMDADVLREMMPYLGACFYNPSAPYAHGREVRARLAEYRSRIAKVLGARPGCVTLTAGATEANNIVFASVRGDVVCSAIEHESVLACVEDRGGRLIEVESEGIATPQAVIDAVGPATELVSVGLANGEIGVVQPIRAIAGAIREERMRRLERGDHRPLLLHTDATQAAGFLSLNVSGLGVDLMTLSAAKIYGPKQVGLLWHAEGVALSPLVRGGGQESGVRSGTENVAGAAGFARALEIAERLRPKESARLASLSRQMRDGISAAVEDAVFSGPRKEKHRLPGLVHVSFPGTEARRLVIALERMGVSVGTGSACAANRMRMSHVLGAIGLDERTAAGSLRVTMGRSTTADDVAYATDAIVTCVRRERERTGGRG